MTFWWKLLPAKSFQRNPNLIRRQEKKGGELNLVEKCQAEKLSHYLLPAQQGSFGDAAATAVAAVEGQTAQLLPLLPPRKRGGPN